MKDLVISALYLDGRGDGGVALEPGEFVRAKRRQVVE